MSPTLTLITLSKSITPLVPPVKVAALERKPGEIETIFDDFRVKKYLCVDGNVDYVKLNNPVGPFDPNDPLFPDSDPETHEYFVGGNFRICIGPDDEFENSEIVANPMMSAASIPAKLVW